MLAASRSHAGGDAKVYFGSVTHIQSLNQCFQVRKSYKNPCLMYAFGVILNEHAQHLFCDNQPANLGVWGIEAGEFTCTLYIK